MTQEASEAKSSEKAPAGASAGARKRVGFAVAGLGKMGIMHASMLGVVSGGKVAALVDRDEKLGQHVRSMGVEAPTFTDLETCLDQVRPEGVWIATPQFAHRSLFEECLKRNVPVFCEKPLAHTLDDARAMAQAAARHPNVPVAVGFMLAHNPVYQQAAAMLAKGVLGQVKSFRASCRLSQVFSPKKGWTFTKEQAGGGVLINSGCHLLYVLIQMFGRPSRVTVCGQGVHNQVEDTLGALVEFSGGVWGMVEVTWSVPGHESQTHEIEVTGTGGVIEAGDERMRLWLHKAGEKHPAGWSLWERAQMQPCAPFSLSPDYCGDEFFLEDQDFVRAVHEGGQPKVGVAQALEVQEVLDAMYRSMAQGKPIELPTAEKGVSA